MFNIFKLSGTDWENLKDSGGLFAAFVFFICVLGAHQQNDHWFVAIGLACVICVLVTFMTVAVVAEWALPWIIFDAVGRLFESLGDRRRAWKQEQAFERVLERARARRDS